MHQSRAATGFHQNLPEKQQANKQTNEEMKGRFSPRLSNVVESHTSPKNEEREKINTKKKRPNRRGYGILEPVVSDEKLLVSSPYSNWQSNKIQSGSVPSVARQGHPEQQQTTTKAKRNIIIRILVTNPQQKPRNKKPTTTTTRVA